MAQNFRNQLTHTAIGTSATDILAQADTFDTIVGIRLVNVAGSAINATCQIVNSGNTTELIKNVPIPAGSSLEIISGSKIIMESSDVLRVRSDTASAVDVAISYLEQT